MARRAPGTIEIVALADGAQSFRGRFTHADEKRLRLRVHRGVPLLQTDRHRRFVEGADIGSRVCHEHIESAELVPNSGEQAGDFRGS